MRFVSTLSFVLLSFMASAQTDTQVPGAVAKAFNEKYPDVSKVTWSDGESKSYEADFESSGVAYTALFADDGKWLKTESTLAPEDLPQTIRAAVTKAYDGYVIVDAELVDSNEQGRLYNLELERDDETVRLTVNEDGKITERENEDDEEG